MYTYIRASAQYHCALLLVVGYDKNGNPLVADFKTQTGSYSLEEALSVERIGAPYYVVAPKSVRYETIQLTKPYKPYMRPPNKDGLQMSYFMLTEGAVVEDVTIYNGQKLDWSRSASIVMQADNQIVRNCSLLGNNGAGIAFSNASNFVVDNCTFVDCCRRTEDVGYLYCWGRNGANGGVIRNSTFINTAKIRKSINFNQQAGPYSNAPFGAWVYGVQIDDNRNDVVIENCFFDGLTVAVIVNGGTNITIRNCVFGPRNARHLWIVGGGTVHIHNCPTFDVSKVLHHGATATLNVDDKSIAIGVVKV